MDETGNDKEELRRIGLGLLALANMREEEIISRCMRIVGAGFPDSMGHTVIAALLRVGKPLCLSELATTCKASRRSVWPGSRVRVIIESLEKNGMVVNLGTRERPRYSLRKDSEEAEMLEKMFGRGRR